MIFFPFNNRQIHIGMIQDDSISFNVRRSYKNYLHFPREVILIPYEYDGVTYLQNKNKCEFLNIALMPVGSVRKELLNFISINW
ncbi:MAG: hypothetical protein AB7U45_13260 [Desulfamplus sp.]